MIGYKLDYTDDDGRMRDMFRVAYRLSTRPTTPLLHMQVVLTVCTVCHTNAKFWFYSYFV